ncbi:MAG: hypothetical protein JWQ27_2832 [Ferruginibacter sp.]|nr:hypothetical protein [Ferruginibacter sp.]
MEIVIAILKYLFYAANIIVAFYFFVPILLFALHYLTGGKRKNLLQRYPVKFNKDFDFAAIVTAHQDTRFIAPLVDSFLKQAYSNFTLYVVADDCPDVQAYYNDPRIVILKPEVALHSKIKSIHYAIDHFKKEHDAMIIFDSDNLVHPNYLQNLNHYFQRGFRVVQTHMLSKNTGSTYAKLDSVGHIYYTFLERTVKMELGISSAILGLGIALELALYREIRYQDTIGGFDKKLQSQLARKVKQIGFAGDAIVYDEKVEESDVFEKQRTRWIYTYFNHFNDSWQLFWAGIKTMHPGRILLGTTMLRPPMFMLIMMMVVLFVISIFVAPFIAIAWIILLFFYALNFVLIIATQSHQRGMMESLIHIPKLMITQVKSLLKIKTAKKDFLKTEHQKIIYIDELLKNELT